MSRSLTVYAKLAYQRSSLDAKEVECMTKSVGKEVLAKLEKGLIVSCQAKPGDPLDDPQMLAAMAQSAQQGGAAGIRAQGRENIRAIRERVSIPIIAITKVEHPGYDVYITPTFEDAAQVTQAGGDVIAIDATTRPRPDGSTVPQLIRRIHEELDRPVMADISTLEEARLAEEAGADLVATTLAGYTPYSSQTAGPDFTLLADIIRECRVPVILEGRVWTPDEARRALEMGAFAVVVGTAITAPGAITHRFVTGMQDIDARAGDE